MVPTICAFAKHKFNYSDCTESQKTSGAISVIYLRFNTYLIICGMKSSLFIITTFSQRFLVVENTYGIMIFQEIPLVSSEVATVN